MAEGEDTGLDMDGASAALRGIAARLADPFLAAFTLSWIAWNWKFLFVLLHTREPSVAPITIANDAWQYINWCQAFVSPTASAAAFTFLYPFFAKWVYVWRAWIQAEGRKDALLKEDAEARALATARHSGTLLTRAEWMKGPEMIAARSDRDAAIERMRDLCVLATHAVHGSGATPQVELVPTPEGVDDAGFAQRSGDGNVYRIPKGTSLDAGTVVYVIRYFASAKRALVAPLRCTFPLPDPPPPGFTRYLTRNGVETLRERPQDPIAHVEMDRGAWGQLQRS